MCEENADLSTVELNEEPIMKFVCPECKELIFEVYIRERGKEEIEIAI